jgi:hypothetical protein
VYGERVALTAAAARRKGSRHANAGRVPNAVCVAAAADGAAGTPLKPTAMLVVGATGTLGRQVRCRREAGSTPGSHGLS